MMTCALTNKFKNAFLQLFMRFFFFLFFIPVRLIVKFITSETLHQVSLLWRTFQWLISIDFILTAIKLWNGAKIEEVDM